MKRIYLATPYTPPQTEFWKWFGWALRWWRFFRVTMKAAKLMLLGHCVFSPITHSHLIAFFIRNPCDCSFWLQQDVEFLEWCDEVHVFCQGGDAWKNSRGVTAELKIAQALKKPIKFHEADK